MLKTVKGRIIANPVWTLNPELKAVILAGRKRATTAAKPLVFQNLGERRIIDYMIENALRVVSPDDLYIVVGHPQANIETNYHYVVQSEQL